MNRGELTDAQWERLRPLLPPRKAWTGRPAKDHRLVLNGILWIDRTGAPWRDLPEQYGPWQTIASRFYRWREAGIWDRILAAVQQLGDAEGRLDWDVHYVDGTIVRAQQPAAGARGGDAVAEALGRGRGGFSTKVHLRVEGGGKPVTLLLTPGQRHEAGAFEQLMEQGAVRRAGRGRPKSRPRRIVGDKGYRSRAIRRYAQRRGIRVTIPRKRNERRRGPFDRAAYRTRNRVERLINRCKQFRRLATRYEKVAENYRAMWVIAAILLWL
ncbi:MAG: IS5 family transposase [Gemmatimonadales bacterium]